MNKHTPGPWAYEPTSGAIYHDDGDVDPLIASTNLECVAVEQGDADGRLIAAAPDLLASLKELIEEIDFEIELRKDGGNDEDWQELQEKSDRAHAAIAKATAA